MSATSPSNTTAPTRRSARRAESVLLAFLLAASAVAPAARADVVDRVVLRVNDRIATLLQYEQRRADAVTQLTSSNLSEADRGKAMADLGNQVFRDMFEELLLLSRADQLRIYPTEEEVDHAVDRIRQGFGIQSEDEFAAVLSRQGMSLAEFRDQVRSQLRMRQVVAQEVTAKIDIEEDDLRRAYRADEDRYKVPERRKVRELIVLENDQTDSQAAEQLARRIYAEIQAGTSFDDEAARYLKQGVIGEPVELGWVTNGELDPALEAALATLQPGQVSEPVQGRGGFHLLELQEVQTAHVKPFSEVEDEIRSREQQRMLADKMGDYLHHLEQDAYVKAEPPADAAGFRTVAGHRERQDPFAGFEPVPGQQKKPDVTPAEKPTPEKTSPPPG